MRIAVVGAGYVGLSNAVVLAQHHDVVTVDINLAKVEMLNRRQSPITDPELEQYPGEVPLSLTATTDAQGALAGVELVAVATPTDYDPDQNFFDTSSVESVIAQVQAVNRGASAVVKSTVPVGFTARMREQYPGAVIVFSPEFLGEGRALYDSLHPSRIVVGDQSEHGKAFADLMVEAALDKDVPVLLTNATEAVFNELDTMQEPAYV